PPPPPPDPDPDPEPEPEPDPGPVDDGGEDTGDEIGDDVGLGDDDSFGGGSPITPTPDPEPAPEPEPEPVPEPVVAQEPPPEPVPEPIVEEPQPEPVQAEVREVEREPEVTQLARAEPRELLGQTREVNRNLGQAQVFSQALDIMSEGVASSDILDELKNNTLQVAFKGSGFALSAGFLSWALRGASLMASVAASLPAWQGFDPLPVLAAKKRKKKGETDEDEKQSADWQEKRVRRLLNPLEDDGDA
ncbi:MAG: hypothetical protein R3286_09930, partial [Gammaproteobacteria bacterium]|nr:hypothetical protein [Gammaproteobacteria bacterium]